MVEKGDDRGMQRSTTETTPRCCRCRNGGCGDYLAALQHWRGALGKARALGSPETLRAARANGRTAAMAAAGFSTAHTLMPCRGLSTWLGNADCSRRCG